MSQTNFRTLRVARFGTFHLSHTSFRSQITRIAKYKDKVEHMINNGHLNERGMFAYNQRLKVAVEQEDQLKLKFMKIDFKGIMEGVWNSIFIKQQVEIISGDRLAICKGCSLNSDHQKKFNNYRTFRPDFHCTDCGCNLVTKTRAMSQNCPKGKWLAQMTEEQEHELNRKLYESQQNKQSSDQGVDQPAAEHG
jgi:hypothetical protein